MSATTTQQPAGWLFAPMTPQQIAARNAQHAHLFGHRQAAVIRPAAPRAAR